MAVRNTKLMKCMIWFVCLLPVLFVVFIYVNYFPKHPVPYTVYDSYDELKSHLAESINADVLYPDLDSLGVQSDTYYQNFTDLSHEKTSGYTCGYTVKLGDHLFTTVTMGCDLPTEEEIETFHPNYNYMDMNIQRGYSIVEKPPVVKKKEIWMNYHYIFFYDGIRYAISTQNNITYIHDQETVVQHLQKHIEDVIRSTGVGKRTTPPQYVLASKITIPRLGSK